MRAALEASNRTSGVPPEREKIEGLLDVGLCPAPGVLYSKRGSIGDFFKVRHDPGDHRGAPKFQISDSGEFNTVELQVHLVLRSPGDVRGGGGIGAEHAMGGGGPCARFESQHI